MEFMIGFYIRVGFSKYSLIPAFKYKKIIGNWGAMKGKLGNKTVIIGGPYGSAYSNFSFFDNIP